MRFKFLVAAAGCALLSRPCAASADVWAKHIALNENLLNLRETAGPPHLVRSVLDDELIRVAKGDGGGNGNGNGGGGNGGGHGNGGGGGNGGGNGNGGGGYGNGGGGGNGGGNRNGGGGGHGGSNGGGGGQGSGGGGVGGGGGGQGSGSGGVGSGSGIGGGTGLGGLSGGVSGGFGGVGSGGTGQGSGAVGRSGTGAPERGVSRSTLAQPSNVPSRLGTVGPNTVGGFAALNSGGGDGASLPESLVPLGGQAAYAVHVPGLGVLLGTKRDLQAAARPLAFKPGTPLALVQACRQSIIAAAIPYGVVQVDAASAGRPRRSASGTFAAPLEVRAIYSRQGGHEVRQSRINCRLNATGTVIALK